MKHLIQKTKHFPILLALAFCFSLVFAPSVSASLFSGAKKEACAGAQLSGPPSAADCTEDDSKKLSTTIQNGIDLVSIIVGIIAVVMVIIGGLRFIVADGDSGKVTTARNTIMYALIGLILVASAQVIVKFVLTRV